MESESPEIANSEQKNKAGVMSCKDAGLCLCDDRGKQVQKLRRGICKFLSKAFPAGSRDELYGAFVVLQFCKTKPGGLLRVADLKCPGIIFLRAVCCVSQYRVAG